MTNNLASSNFAQYQYKVIQELKNTIDSLTTQLDASEKLRMIEQAKFIQQKKQKPLETIVATNALPQNWNLPFVFEINSDNENNIEADVPYFLYIKDDKSRGLRVPASAGYIKNDGPGKISYRLNSGDSKKWSHPATIMNGEFDVFNGTDNIEIVTIEITADTDKTRFRTRFTPKIME